MTAPPSLVKCRYEAVFARLRSTLLEIGLVLVRSITFARFIGLHLFLTLNTTQTNLVNDRSGISKWLSFVLWIFRRREIKEKRGEVVQIHGVLTASFNGFPNIFSLPGKPLKLKRRRRRGERCPSV